MTPRASDLTDQAQRGLESIKNAIRGLLASAAEGMTNYEVAKALGLETSFEGKHKNYLTYVVLHQLIKEGVVVTRTLKRNRIYSLVR